MKDKKFRKFLFSLYKPVKFLFFIMAFSVIFQEIFVLIRQYIIKGIIDLPNMSGFKITDLYSAIVSLIIVIIFGIVCQYIQNISRSIYIVKKQEPYISEKLFNNLNNKKYSFFVDNYSGKISTAINDVINQVTDLNSRIAKDFVSLVASIITSLILLYTIDIKIFIFATILFLGIIITRIIYFQKRYLPLLTKSQDYNREYNGILNDAVMNFSSLKIYNAIKNFSINLKSKKRDTNYYQIKARVREFSYGALANVTYILSFTILLAYSINNYTIGTMTLGNLVFFINAMISLKKASTDFSWSYIKIGEVLVKIKNSYDVLYNENNVEVDNKPSLKVEAGKIEIKDMNFKYNNDYVFEDFNFVINPKEKIGIIGESGSGKTTLVNLLFKFYKPQHGKILIDGNDINKFSTKSLYEELTYVPQETILLHSTIYENIRIAKPNASNEEIVSAAKKAELYNFIEKLPDKFQTIVGERGIKLSGGQRQRIALARIFLRNSKIVIFDEATSSLDNGTEFKIQKNINKYFNNQTIICIAHRLSTLTDMDKIVVIDKGKIIDSGLPNDIIPKYERKELLLED